MIELYKQPQYTEKDLCNFARVCTESSGNDDKKLIRDLIIWDHMSPFRHIAMTFVCEDIPIYTMRQWTRHQVGSEFLPVFEDKDSSAMMEKSGRYTEMEKFHFKTSDCGEELALDTIDKLYDSLAWYKELIALNIKKEEARQVLPLCTTTKFIWTVNLDSLMHFLSLRMDKHAQKDIRENAEEIYKLFEESYPTVAKEWKRKNDFDKGMVSVYGKHYEMFAGMKPERIVKEIDDLIFGG